MTKFLEIKSSARHCRLGLRASAWAVTLSMLATASPGAAQTLELYAPDGLFRLQIVLTGRLPVPALVDTGASKMLLCKRTADALGLVRGDKIDLATITTPTSGHSTHISSLRLGPIHVRDVAAVIVDTGPSCAEAVIGLSALRKLKSLTLSGNTLTLVGPDMP
jgi:clan AA aspartic protease (TIGR02281 family)